MSTLAKHPKFNYLRVRIAIHRLKHSSEVAVSYTDAPGIIHRTPFCRSQAQAETRLRHWLNRTTGIGMISFVATSETIEEKTRQ